MRKLSKKLVAACMTAAMMLTMVPAAFAAEPETELPTTIWAHGEEIELPVIDPIIPLANNDIATLSETDNSVTITSQEQFEAISAADWRKGITYYLACDIDLSQLSAPEWGGYIQYFDSNLIGVVDEDGNKPIISGFANNRYLIYGMIRGTIANIELHMDGNAGALSFVPTVYSNVDDTSYYRVNIENVDVTGVVNLTEADQSNYSPFVYAASSGDFTMKDCTNYADITGDIYGAIFHGYYALNTTGAYTFNHCVNEGNVELRNAAMFFGNPATMNSKLDNQELNVTVMDCENNGMIAGSISAHYFAPSLNSQDYPAGETALAAKETSMTQGTPAPVTVGDSAGLCHGKTSKLSGSISDDNTITFSYNATQSGIDHYLVTVSSYVQVWNETFYNGEQVIATWDGTDRYSVSESIEPTESTEYTATLKYLGVCDEDYGLWGDNILDYSTNTSMDGNDVYYVIDPTKSGDPDLTFYATRAMTDEGTPAGNGCAAPSFATVYAIGEDGNILDFVSLK